MKVLHLLASAGIGGIETLCKDYACFSKHDNIFCVLWGVDEYTSLKMKENRDNIIELNSSKKKFIDTFRRIEMICSQEKVEIVIGHHASPIIHIYLIMLKKYFGEIKTITYAHGNAVDMYRINAKKGLWIRKKILSYSLRNADKTIAISQSVKNSLIKHLKTPEEKIQVIYNGTNIEKFSCPIRRLSNPLKLIYVGRLIEEKGIQNTLKALTYFTPGMKYHFQIVGNGPYKKHLEKIVCELKLSENVQFMGTRYNIPELLNDADIFIHMPEWEEGFGITIIEAMAAGVICVCSNNGAISEIINNKKNGYLVTKECCEELASVIKKILIQSNEENKRVQMKAQETAKQYSIDKFAKNLDDLILSL